jgi:hypothetical protein
MTAEHTASRFIIEPAKSLVILTVCLAGATSALLLLMPILFWVKSLAVFLIAIFLYLEIIQLATARADRVIYQPGADRWIVNGNRVYLSSHQLVTRNLIVMYFVDTKGKKLVQLAPADSMSREQHRRLRKLLISCL